MCVFSFFFLFCVVRVHVDDLTVSMPVYNVSATVIIIVFSISVLSLLPFFIIMLVVAVMLLTLLSLLNISLLFIGSLLLVLWLLAFVLLFLVMFVSAVAVSFSYDDVDVGVSAGVMGCCWCSVAVVYA